MYNLSLLCFVTQIAFVTQTSGRFLSKDRRTSNASRLVEHRLLSEAILPVFFGVHSISPWVTVYFHQLHSESPKLYSQLSLTRRFYGVCPFREYTRGVSASVFRICTNGSPGVHG